MESEMTSEHIFTQKDRTLPVTELEKWLEKAQSTLDQAEQVDAIKARLLPWKIGDIMNEGYAKFGDDYGQAVDPQKHKPGTILNRMKVCKAYPEPRKWADKLSFSHHAEVYTLPDDVRDDFLRQSHEHDMSVAELRRIVREDYPKKTRHRSKSGEKKEVEAHPYDRFEAMKKALKDLLDYYENGVLSGDLGNWDHTKEEVVINARKALGS